MVTEDIFARYVKVQVEGLSNMLDMRYVLKEAQITEEEYMDIIHNYAKYANLYPGVYDIAG